MVNLSVEQEVAMEQQIHTHALWPTFLALGLLIAILATM